MISLSSMLVCLCLSLMFVSSLYIWKLDKPRDHPETIKKRMLSVGLVSLVAPLYTYMLLPSMDMYGVSFFRLVGLHCFGLIPALVFPLSLTMLLFLGPIVMMAIDIGPNGVVAYLHPKALKESLLDALTWRNYVVAPISEEWVFRACMLPLLMTEGMDINTAVLVSPWFFGLAHLHHVIDYIHYCGKTVRSAWMIVIFQLVYTSMFGSYSAFIFLRTGHALPLFLIHCFCNIMGFPDFHGALTHPKKYIVLPAFVIGLAGFIIFLYGATDPSIYSSVYFGYHTSVES